MDKPRLIKKYANRRLYDTVESRHVTLADIRTLIVAGTDIRVIDDTSGDDITRPLLLQIIVDREQAGQPLLSEVLLAQLIRFYGNPMQGMMADYLQRSVDTFLHQQQSVQTRLQSALSKTPLDTMRELMLQNAATWETLLGLGPDGQSPGDRADEGAADGARPSPTGPGDDEPAGESRNPTEESP